VTPEIRCCYLSLEVEGPPLRWRILDINGDHLPPTPIDFDDGRAFNDSGRIGEFRPTPTCIRH
jgi:hypothetical protein